MEKSRLTDGSSVSLTMPFTPSRISSTWGSCQLNGSLSCQLHSPIPWILNSPTPQSKPLQSKHPTKSQITTPGNHQTDSPPPPHWDRRIRPPPEAPTSQPKCSWRRDPPLSRSSRAERLQNGLLFGAPLQGTAQRSRTDQGHGFCNSRFDLSTCYIMNRNLQWLRVRGVYIYIHTYMHICMYMYVCMYVCTQVRTKCCVYKNCSLWWK